MPFASNVNPADIPNSGLLIPAGTTVQDACYKIVQNMLTLGAAIFEEVTAGSHANLQKFASTIVADDTGSTLYTTNSPSGTWYHRTLAFKADPFLASGEAALFRFTAGQYAIGIQTLDTRAAGFGSSNPNQWTYTPYNAASNNNVMNGKNKAGQATGNSAGTVSARYQNLFFMAAPTGTTSSSGNATMDTDMRYYWWAGDDWFFGITQRVNDLSWWGCSYGCFLTPPADGHWTRQNAPGSLVYTPAYTGTEYALFSGSTHTASGYNANDTRVQNELSLLNEGVNTIDQYPDFATPGDLEITGRPYVAIQNGERQKAWVPGVLPGLRFFRPIAASEWATVTINGVQFIRVPYPSILVQSA